MRKAIRNGCVYSVSKPMPLRISASFWKPRALLLGRRGAIIATKPGGTRPIVSTTNSGIKTYFLRKAALVLVICKVSNERENNTMLESVCVPRDEIDNDEAGTNGGAEWSITTKAKRAPATTMP